MQEKVQVTSLNLAPDEAKQARARALELLAWIASELGESLSHSCLMDTVTTSDITTSRALCLSMWPFVRSLPDNISVVKDKLALLTKDGSNDGGLNLLTQLADDERHYQKLYLRQFILAGMTDQEIEELAARPDEECSIEEVLNLKRRMHYYCHQGTTEEGVLAIITAELVATQFARIALKAFETYFHARIDKYGKETIDEGLAWLTLHAKPNTRHAIWMKRMLITVEKKESQSNNRPECVKDLLACLAAIWKTPKIK